MLKVLGFMKHFARLLNSKWVIFDKIIPITYKIVA